MVDKIDCSLAMAEMTTLVVAIYQRYSTSIKMGCEDLSPGITSRFEVFHDDRFEKIAVRTWYDRPNLSTVMLILYRSIRAG